MGKAPQSGEVWPDLFHVEVARGDGHEALQANVRQRPRERDDGQQLGRRKAKLGLLAADVDFDHDPLHFGGRLCDRNQHSFRVDPVQYSKATRCRFRFVRLEMTDEVPGRTRADLRLLFEGFLNTVFAKILNSEGNGFHDGG